MDDIFFCLKFRNRIKFLLIADKLKFKINMSKKQKNSKSKSNYPIGKQAVKAPTDSKNEFYEKHKSTIWTIVVIIILAIFFIVNNTRDVPEHGPYPPNYHGPKSANDSN